MKKHLWIRPQLDFSSSSHSTSYSHTNNNTSYDWVQTRTLISVKPNPLWAFSLKGHFLKLHFLLQRAASYSSPFISNRKCKHNALWEMPSASVNEGSSLVSGHTLPGIEPPPLTARLCRFLSLSLSFCCLTLSHLVSISCCFTLLVPSSRSFFSFYLFLARSFGHSFVSFWTSIKLNLSRWKLSCYSRGLFLSPVYHSSFFSTLFSPFFPHLSSFSSLSLSLPHLKSRFNTFKDGVKNKYSDKQPIWSFHSQFKFTFKSFTVFF